MNRLIKFRAWIKSGFDEDIKPFMANVSVIRFEAGNMETDEDDNLWDLENDVILMQFTGLHDKNGKEIYEGDIVDCDISTRIGSDTIGYPIGYLKKRGVIEYQDKLGSFTVRFGEEIEICGVMKIVESGRRVFEVIGNIYENPNLLENKPNKHF